MLCDIVRGLAGRVCLLKRRAPGASMVVTILMAALLAGSSATAGGVEPLIWSARTANAEQAKLAQTRFYLSLFNTGRLPLRTVMMQPEDKEIGDILRREGAWVGGVTAGMASLLCLINDKVCTMDRKDAPASALKDPTSHIGGYLIDASPVWKAHAGRDILIPEIKISQTSRPEPAREDYVDAVAIDRNLHLTSAATCLDKKGWVCVSDYASLREIVTGRLRDVSFQTPDATPDATGSEPLPAPAGGPTIAFVPHLNVVIAPSEQPLPVYADIEVSKHFSFDDPDFRRLAPIVSGEISGNMMVKAQSRPSDLWLDNKLRGEPRGRDQRSIFESFYNVTVHEQPPDMGGAAHAVTIAIIDQTPDTDHCDFEDLDFTWINIAGAQSSAGIDVTDDGAVAAAADGDDLSEAVCGEVPEPVLREHHGTHVLGILAARKNGTGGTGLLGDVQNIKYIIIPIDTAQIKLDPAYQTELATAIGEAVNQGTSIINMSISYELIKQRGGLAKADQIREVIDRWQGWVTFVAAAGDEGIDADTGPCLTMPACYHTMSNVISVVGLEVGEGGIRLLGDGADTNYGASRFQVGAPARDVISTIGRTGYGAMSGTSQATPQVTAAAALLKRHFNLRPAEIRDRLLYTSSLDLALASHVMGGAVDVTAALGMNQDRLTLIDGCVLLGRARRVEFTDTDDAADFMLFFEPDDAVKHLRLREIRRLFWDRSQDKYIVFYTLDGGVELIRRIGTYHDGRRNRTQLVFDVASASTVCEVDSQASVDIPLANVKDYVAGDPKT